MQVEAAVGQLEEEVGEAAAHGQQPVAQRGLEAERDVVALLAARVHLRVAALLQGHRRYLGMVSPYNETVYDETGLVVKLLFSEFFLHSYCDMGKF